MTTRRSFVRALAGAALFPLAPAHAASAEAPLKEIARRKGLRFGTALGSIGDRPGRARFRDPAYCALVARECAVIVHENEMKWPALQPVPGAYRFGPADDMLAWAQAHGMRTRGHNLFWQAEQWLPAWVNAFDFGVRPAAAAEQLMREHVRAVCTHFGGDIYSYDVVNEAVDPADGGLRSNALTRRLGALEQIDLAFRLAHECAPHAQLVYNDYMEPGAGSARHRAGVLALLEALRRRGTPVHALGLQSHIGCLDEDRKAGELDQWRRFLDAVTSMGYDLLITEFDVNDRRLPADIALRDAGVASAARDYLDLTLSYPRLRDFLVWGMADHVSWLQEWQEAKRDDGLPMRPCPFDSQLHAKPLRDAIAQALRAMPARA